MTQTLASQARAGTAWVAVQALAKHGLDLIVFLVLARWLAPQAFGLMALVHTVLSVVLMLSELGLGDALVQRRRLGPVTRDTAFWLALGAGVALALFLVALAWPLAKAYGQPEVALLTWAAVPLVLMTALNTVPQALLQREMRFRPLATRALVGSLCGALTGVLLAVSGAGVWSLIGQQLVTASIALVLLWWLCDWRPQRKFSRKAARVLLGFGRHVLSARGLNIVASKIDDALIGVVLGPVALGAYAVASRLRLALEQLFCQGVDAVALSAFSRLAQDRAALAKGYLQATRLAISLALPVFISAIWLAPHLLPLWMGPRWLAAMDTLQILLLAGLLQSFLHFNHLVFRALGCPERSWQLGSASLAINLLLGALVVRGGIEAVAWAYVARVALVGPWGMVLALGALGLGWRNALIPLLRPLAAAALAVLPAAALWQGLTQSGWGATAPWQVALLASLPFWAVYGWWLKQQHGLSLRRDSGKPGAKNLSGPHVQGGSQSRRWAPNASRGSHQA